MAASNHIYLLLWSVCFLDSAVVMTLQLPDDMPVTLPAVSSSSASLPTFQASEGGLGNPAGAAGKTSDEQSSPTNGGNVTLFPNPSQESVVGLTTSLFQENIPETTHQGKNQSNIETSSNLRPVGNKKTRKKKEKRRKKKKKPGKDNMGKISGRKLEAMNLTSLHEIPVLPLAGNFTNIEEGETTPLPFLVATTRSTKDGADVSVAQTLVTKEVEVSEPHATPSSSPTQHEVTQDPEGVPWGEKWMWYLGEVWNLPVLLLIFAGIAVIILGGCLCVLCCWVATAGTHKKKKFDLREHSRPLNIEHPHFGNTSYRRVSTADGNTMTTATTTTGYDLSVQAVTSCKQDGDSLDWEMTSETESKSESSEFDRDYDSVEGASVCDEDPESVNFWYEDAVPHNMNHAVSRLEPCSPNTFWQKTSPGFSTFAKRTGSRSHPTV